MYRLTEHALSARCRKQMKKQWSSNDPQVVSSRGNLILPTYNNVRSLVEHHGFHWFSKLLQTKSGKKKAFNYMPSLEQINKTKTVWSQPLLTEVPPNLVDTSAQVERVELPKKNQDVTPSPLVLCTTTSAAATAQPTSSQQPGPSRTTAPVATTSNSAQPPLSQQPGPSTTTAPLQSDNNLE